jgi:hypothetical protein
VTRRAGSGLANLTTRAIEDMWSGALADDQEFFHDAVSEHRRQELRGRSGIETAELATAIVQAVKSLNLDVASSTPRPLDGLGDVRCLLRSGELIWFELKAQTTKPRFGDITQADWVRDDTDFVRYASLHERVVRSALPPWAIEILNVDQPDEYFSGWDFNGLWAADMCLLSNRTKREVAGVRRPADLVRFAERKVLVQIAQPGIRMVPFASIAPIKAVLDGSAVDRQFVKANQSAISIQLSSPGRAGRGTTNFAYHVAYPSNVLGRHKMHAISIDLSPKTEHLFP